MQRVIIDTDNLLLFQIDFSEGRPPLILESFERDRLGDELAICWKADSMFRMWRWMPFPKKRGQCDLAKRDRTATEFTAAPTRMMRVELGGYLVFLDDAYRGDPPGPDGKPTGRFRLSARIDIRAASAVPGGPIANIEDCILDAWMALRQVGSTLTNAAGRTGRELRLVVETAAVVSGLGRREKDNLRVSRPNRASPTLRYSLPA